MRAKVIVVLTFLLFSVGSGLAGTETVLYSFTGGTDGAQPYLAGVIFDSAGNLYGVTQYGGAYNQGTVFKLTPSPGGTWTETVLYSFTGGADGANPQGGLATDGAGDFYGTTYAGGEDNDQCGTLFEINSGLQFSVLHTFDDMWKWDGYLLDACAPQADVKYSGGNIWGTTEYGGGVSEHGAAFALFSDGIYRIWALQGSNGAFPFGGLVTFGENNWAYGTSSYAARRDGGNVFETVYDAEVRIVHPFKCSGKYGCSPAGDLATQVNENGVWVMYGANMGGGSSNQGTIYQLTQKPDTYWPYDEWTVSLLHSFSGSEGTYPYGGVVLGPTGAIYGTTYQGGTENSGTVFQLTPVANNKWSLTVLYSFSGGTDGNAPTGSVVLDNAGNLYGTTNYGGAYGQGVVYEVTTAAATTTTLTSSPNPSTRGQAVTFTAVVASSAGIPPDGETVSFMKGKTTLGTGLLSGASASFTTSTLGSGTFPITAVYGGDPNFAASTSNVVEQVVTKP
ncbi:MAG: choice-of-anchor tandem repeat GloVer-containing protein [Terriglobales bacterium]|jgi:uncharacterized repeat protein (TIGR03803 family)